MSSYQHVVIGGGVHGCAAAYHLARSGRSVVLLEAATLASAASGGFGKRGVRGNKRDLRELPLLRRAYTLWPGLSDLLGADVGYERTGGVNLIERPATGLRGGLVAARAHAQVQSALGVPTEVIDRERVLDLLPEVTDAVVGGLHAPLDGMGDQTATTRAYAAAAQRFGAVVVEGARVTRLERDGAVVRAVICDDGERYEVGESVLVAANAGAAPLVERELGVALPLWTIYPQALRIRPPGTSPARLLVGHDSRTVSLKTVEDGVVMVSGGWQGRPGSDGSGEVLEDQVEGNLREAGAVFPALAAAELLEASAARPESCAQDQIPIIDVVPGTANVLVAAGWTGHGFAIAPAVAEELSGWMLSGRRPPALAPFAVDRFVERVGT
ncbi:FAD-binding oxidoreductase [Pseudonocardia sp. MH-G8]|uniref:NAD(P)/FAD-dependent oxidoreductase n=1 Tax=Pseudonocardia sp. MH-G8 TaxID=1854588 RepID=UPI000BA06D68|nr:FAD-binding oxidoreductase [Pseudonocardia sp. MH-G8]OZM79606.1 FAD-dependent oxidoreductase [Pseudonocardia sp. MH-G8]